MRVPVYDNLQSTIDPGNAGRVRNQDVGQIGAESAQQADQLGKALTGAGNALSDIVLQRRAIINEADAKKADVAGSTAERAILHDPTHGYLNLRGENAINGADTARSGVDKVYDDAGKDLTGDARRMYDDLARRRKEIARAQIDEHLGKEQLVYASDQSEARQSSFQDGMTVNAANEALYAQNKKGLENEVESQAKVLGWSKEVHDAKLLAARTGAHLQVIDSYLSKDQGTLAKQYYTAHADEIEPSKRAKVAQLVDAANAASVALTAVNDLTATIGDNDAFPISDIYKKLQVTFKDDPTALKYATEEARNQYNLHEIQQKEIAQANKAKVYDDINKGKPYRASAAYQALPGDMRESIDEHMHDKNRQAVSERRADISWAQGQESYRRGQIERREQEAAGMVTDDEAAGMSENEIIAKFPHSIDYMRQRKANAISGKGQYKAPTVSEDVMNRLAKSAGLKPTSTKEKDQRAVGYFRFVVGSALQDAQAAKGSTLTANEATTAAQSVLTQAVSVERQGLFGYHDTKDYKLFDFKLEDIAPTEQRQAAVDMAAAYERSGGDPRYEPTEENLTLYAAVRHRDIMAQKKATK